MKDITKENFMYCLRAKEGKGCLCAAMFHIYKDENMLQVKFESGTDKYSDKTRQAWKVPFAGEEEMQGFYEVHKETIEFLATNYPNADWWAVGQQFDDTNRTAFIPDFENRTAPDGMSKSFWEQQFVITKKMFDRGYLNGNYPQGHYCMKDNRLLLMVSYFGSYRHKKLSKLFQKSLNSCHKLSDSNLKKNWLIKEIVKNKSEMNNIVADDFWRLSLASQLYNSNEYKDTYLRKYLNLLGPSYNKKYQNYIQCCLDKNYKEYEISSE